MENYNSSSFPFFFLIKTKNKAKPTKKPLIPNFEKAVKSNSENTQTPAAPTSLIIFLINICVIASFFCVIAQCCCVLVHSHFSFIHILFLFQFVFKDSIYCPQFLANGSLINYTLTVTKSFRICFPCQLKTTELSFHFARMKSFTAESHSFQLHANVLVFIFQNRLSSHGYF